MLIRVLMFSDRPIMAKGIEAILLPCGDFRFFATQGKYGDLLSAIESIAPDILVLDFHPIYDLKTLLSLHSDLSPRRDLNTVLLVHLLVHTITPDLAHQAIELGVRGILHTSASSAQVLDCLYAVASGDYWFDEDLRSRLYRHRTLALSPRESQLVILVSQGLSNREISRVLGISDATVRTYLSTVFRKLGLKNRHQLALCGTRKLLGAELNEKVTFSGTGADLELAVPSPDGEVQ